MKEYLIPICTFFPVEDVIATSALIDNGTLNLDNSNGSDYAKIFWNNDQKN